MTKKGTTPTMVQRAEKSKPNKEAPPATYYQLSNGQYLFLSGKFPDDTNGAGQYELKL